MKDIPLIIDGHLDLSMNAMEWNRDLTQSITEIRKSESGLSDKPDRGNNTVSFSAMRTGNIGMCIATLIARYAKPTHPLGGWQSPEQAWAMTQAQLTWYREMERLNHLTPITNEVQLENHLDNWNANSDQQPIGYLLSLEGADSIITMDHLYQMYEEGLRAIGPAHYGPGTYAYGTDSDGPIGDKGRLLLRTMDELNMVLDVTHLSDTSFWEAIDCFQGPIWASHNNCRSLVNHNRQFTDEQIKIIIERNGVIGIALDAWMIVSDWQRAISHPSNTSVTLSHVLDHLDHICQIAGNADHVCLGTDLDGGFGTEQCPSDINTIADLQLIPDLLKARAYTIKQINGILHGNWINKFKSVLAK